MKKVWVEPNIAVQQFMANEYVAACVVGIIQCVYPGNCKSKGDNGRYDDYNGNQTGWYKDEEGKLHGICGYNALITFNGDTASGFEAVYGVTQFDRPIYDISGYEEEVGTYYNVTWTSKDTRANTEYHHKGRLMITDIDKTRPNHS
ncbi:MAG: hypothetical protein PUB22_05015 [Clostridiales bacterium]|nr:hypothetical protein [Clostridiales bacterium]